MNDSSCGDNGHSPAQTMGLKTPVRFFEEKKEPFIEGADGIQGFLPNDETGADY